MVKQIITIQKAADRHKHVHWVTNAFQNPIQIHLPRPILLTHLKLHPPILITHPRQELLLPLDLYLMHNKNHRNNGKKI